VGKACERIVNAFCGTTGLAPAAVALQWFEKASQHNRQNSTIWRCLGHTSSALVDQDTTEEQKAAHLKTAISAHFRCIEYGTGTHSLPATLRLLTMWFRHGDSAEVEDQMAAGFADVPADTWLDVVPQIIARLNSNAVRVKSLVHQILIAVGLRHPQLLVYPLTVAAKTADLSRQEESLSVLDQIRRSFPVLMDEALLVCREMIRIAILWPELCFDAIGQALQQYSDQNDILRTLEIISVMHLQVTRQPETPSEQTFTHSFKHRLIEAWDHFRQYGATKATDDFQLGIKLYSEIYERLNAELPNISTLELHHVSPALYRVRGLNVCLPGSYQPSREVISVSRFFPKVCVVKSKQRPRKLGLIGSDGETYAYLLKGKEDIRQDERVMQLFGLINNLLAADSFCSKRELHIVRYPCVPISQNSGLIFWVPFTDTILDIIKIYRQSRGINLNTEYTQMGLRAPPMSQLTLLHRIDTFRFALSNSDGVDLQRFIWDRSSTSEIWLERRTNYIRSLAVMSMSGYILGLGDRHPANLMMLRRTGVLLHIDYGDCFEVAMERETLPETVPFRLTRILINAMECCGVEGTFRQICEATMSLMRQNKDSLMAILETFLYDPLISMRIIEGDHNGPGGQDNVEANISYYKVSSQVSSQGAPQVTPQVAPRVAPIQAQHSTLDYRLLEDGASKNPKVLEILQRVEAKLTGHDQVYINRTLTIEEQVAALINSATSFENLCQLYQGWCPQW